MGISNTVEDNSGVNIPYQATHVFVGVHMAARSLITLYRQLNPDMLQKKHRVSLLAK